MNNSSGFDFIANMDQNFINVKKASITGTNAADPMLIRSEQ